MVIWYAVAKSEHDDGSLFPSMPPNAEKHLPSMAEQKALYHQNFICDSTWDGGLAFSPK